MTSPMDVRLPDMADLSTAPADTLPPIGPDHTRAPDDGALLADEAPKINQKHRPRPVADALRRASKATQDNLGANKKRGSGVRALTKKDRDKIANFYRALAAGMMMFRPKAAELMELSADDAADAWLRWAEENDATRRWLLTWLEGTAVMNLIVIHLPLAFAFVPDSAWEKLPPVAQFMHPDMVIARMRATSMMDNDAA